VSITGTRTAQAPAVNVRGNPRGVTIRNNLLVASRTRLVTSLDFARGQVLFQGNNLYAAAGPWAVGWGEAVYPGLRRWRAATGQERVRGADSGLAADPGFARGAPPAILPGTLTAFVPNAGSPVVGGALDLSGFGIDPGPVDVTGRPLGGPATVGAAQPAA
jgi:hypothetical protein